MSTRAHNATVTIGGKRWQLVYDRVPLDSDGICDAPNTKNKRIRIRPGLKKCPKLLLETLIHEGLHAESWPLDEGFVKQAASDIANLLWRQGFHLEA